jgi:hypothetical protein
MDSGTGGTRINVIVIVFVTGSDGAKHLCPYEFSHYLASLEPDPVRSHFDGGIVGIWITQSVG